LRQARKIFIGILPYGKKILRGMTQKAPKDGRLTKCQQVLERVHTTLPAALSALDLRHAAGHFLI
jgi:hypothetical protein